MNPMSKKFIALFATVFFLLFFHSCKSPFSEKFGEIEEYAPNEVLVKFKTDVSKYFIQDAINSVQGKIITYLGEEISTFQWDPDIRSFRSFLSDPYLLHIKVPETLGTEKAIDLLSLNPSVEYAEKNGIFHLFSDPNDPDFDLLWGMKNTGVVEKRNGKPNLP